MLGSAAGHTLTVTLLPLPIHMDAYLVGNNTCTAHVDPEGVESTEAFRPDLI